MTTTTKISDLTRAIDLAAAFASDCWGIAGGQVELAVLSTAKTRWMTRIDTSALDAEAAWLAGVRRIFPSVEAL